MVRSLWFAAVMALSALGCSFNESAPGGSCIQGQELRCLCNDGTHGVYTCQPDGTFSTCMCTLESPGSAGSPPNAQAGAQSGGASSPAANPGAAGTGASGGSGGASAGSGTGASGSGVAGSGGNAGAAGAGAGGADPAGSGGSGGFGGSGEAGSNGAPPGSMYTPCLSDADCDTELLCTASNMSLMPGYCTRFCDPSSGGSCPQPRSGTVDAVCFEFASICALGDCEGARCPNGMECMQLSFGGGTLWNCSYR